jgi:hypothetical protein
LAILAALFAAIGRQTGRVLTTALGWASTLLFGRVPRQKQLLLSLISLGSLAWVVLLLGIAMTPRYVCARKWAAASRSRTARRV